MLRALASRLTQAVMVMLVVTACAFLMFRFVGDPVRILSREDATQEEKAELARSLGLDQP
ncbi:MAG: ABC transporter permease, partial [Microvirga sp.]